jgi:rhodanese-related sulfurtransferase/DNA-binding MarR family transcriptional regulator
MPNRAAKTELFDEFASVAGALASGRRAEIIDVLANGDRTVEQLSRQVALSVANTSQHLQVLKEAGLVASTRDGNRIRYRLASPTVYQFWATLRALTAERAPGIERLVEAYVGARDEVEPIGGEELRKRMRSGEPLVVIDVRPAEEYRSGHIPGARSVPLDELEKRLHELPRRREIVVYCRGPYCAFAPEAVQTLRRAGFKASRLADGLPEWATAGFDVEATA